MTSVAIARNKTRIVVVDFQNYQLFQAVYLLTVYNNYYF